MNPQFDDVMVDLETVGTLPGSAILSLGAVLFSREHDILGPKFEVFFNLQDQARQGLHMDAATVAWWMEQSAEAKVLWSRALDWTRSTTIAGGLANFGGWLRESRPHDSEAKALRMWCNGANFDDPLLQVAAKASNMTLPWKFYKVRCLRTALELYQDAAGGELPTVTPAEVKHSALDDAEYQARRLIAAARFAEGATSQYALA